MFIVLYSIVWYAIFKAYIVSWQVYEMFVYVFCCNAIRVAIRPFLWYGVPYNAVHKLTSPFLLYICTAVRITL